MKSNTKFIEKFFAIALLLPLLAASCGVRNTPDSVSGVEERESEQISSAQEENAETDASAEGNGGITAVAEYHYIEMDSAIKPEDTSSSYTINREWMYVTDYIENVEKSREYEEAGWKFYYFGITRKRIADGYQVKNYIVTDIESGGKNRPLLMADREGNCYIFWRFYDWEEDANTYSLEKYDMDGELLWRQEPTEEELEGMGEQLEQGTVDRDGRVILYSCGDGCVFRFGADGRLEEIYKPELESLDGVAIGQDSRAYGYCISTEKAVFMELGSTGAAYVCPMAPSAVYDGYEEGLCLGDEKGMFVYEPESGEVRQLWNWSDEYLLLGTGKLDRVCQDGGAFTLLCEFSDKYWSFNRQLATFACVTFEDSRKYPGKQTITLAMDDTSNTITSTLVQMYNRQSRKYRVKIVSVGDGAALQAQLMRGGNADLVDVSRIYTGNLARMGAFEELDPYYENSSVLRQEDILKSVREACAVAGKNVTVMPGFVISTMRARGDFVKTDEWTVWKFLEMGAENRMLTSQGPDFALNISMGTNYGEHFIDYENRTCSFDGEEFRRILESCCKWETYVEYSGGGMIESSTGKGDWLFDYQSISYPTDVVWVDRSDYADIMYNYEGEDYSSTLVGYPGWEGGEYRLRAYSLYAINSASQNKEGAWDFLEYMLSEELQAKLPPMLAMFPVRKDSFDDYLKDDYDDPMINWSTLSEKDITKIQEMADSAILDNLGSAYNPVTVIVSEEAAMYFAGDATLDETVKKIQSRVQLYLDEM